MTRSTEDTEEGLNGINRYRVPDQRPQSHILLARFAIIRRTAWPGQPVWDFDDAAPEAQVSSLLLLQCTLCFLRQSQTNPRRIPHEPKQPKQPSTNPSTTRPKATLKGTLEATLKKRPRSSRHPAIPPSCPSLPCCEAGPTSLKAGANQLRRDGWKLENHFRSRDQTPRGAISPSPRPCPLTVAPPPRLSPLASLPWDEEQVLCFLFWKSPSPWPPDRGPAPTDFVKTALEITKTSTPLCPGRRLDCRHCEA